MGDTCRSRSSVNLHAIPLCYRFSASGIECLVQNVDTFRYWNEIYLHRKESWLQSLIFQDHWAIHNTNVQHRLFGGLIVHTGRTSQNHPQNNLFKQLFFSQWQIRLMRLVVTYLLISIFNWHFIFFVTLFFPLSLGCPWFEYILFMSLFWINSESQLFIIFSLNCCLLGSNPLVIIININKWILAFICDARACTFAYTYMHMRLCVYIKKLKWNKHWPTEWRKKEGRKMRTK